VSSGHDTPHAGDEHGLAARALAGDARAWDELVRRHSGRVRLSLLACGVPLDAADDLVQETWTRLVAQQRAGRLRDLRLPGLAVRQARWLAREAVRTGSRREGLVERQLEIGREPGESAEKDNPEDRVIHRERLAVMWIALDECPPRARAVFLAVYGPGGRAHADVAHDFGLSLQRVRQILCEVRAHMRHALAEVESFEEES
jgi:RNA polymerase sigma factor (sigma-70 family)